MYQWMAANVAGHTKRSVSSTLLSAAVAVGGIIGPYALRPQDAPKYHLARIVLLVCKLIAFTLVLILGAYYLWINKVRLQRLERCMQTQLTRCLAEKGQIAR